MNKKAFFDKLRSLLPGALKDSSQVQGIEFILDEGLKRKLPLNQIAYVLATAYHETAHTFRPIKEYGSDKYLRSKPYWPYIGRGYVQITWYANYKKYGIHHTPDKALEPETARMILYDGMINGKFTGKKLSDYFNATQSDWRNARRIVNGMDRADLIGGYGRLFLEALNAGNSTPVIVDKPTKKGFWATFFEKLFGG